LDETSGADQIVSRNKNLIVIMLDTFQSDVFAELVATHPEIACSFTGFTYFNDAASVYPYTEVSIPGVLTGVEYENQAPYNHYLYQSYRAPTSILATLVENGYYVEVDRWGIATPIPYLSTLASNFTAYRLPPLSTIRDMALVALYSELPRFGKRLVYQRVSETLIDVQGTLDNNMNFIRNLSKLGVETIDQPVAKVIHLKGPHVPLRRYDRYGFDYFAAASDLNATFSEVATSRENYKAVAMQALLSVAAYLEKLKLAHAYDNATIFVFGDHGAGLQGQQFVLPAGWPVKSPDESITGQLPTSAIPLLLVKRAAAAGTMATSATAASLEDINCTVFRELGIARPGTCVSLFDSGIASRGARRFLWPRVATFSRGYLPTLREFKIKGPVWEESSWTSSGRGFAPGNNIRIPATAYEIGQTIRFGTKGNATEYQSYGWGDPGDGFTWTIGKRATMTLPLASTHPGPLSLEATLIPFVVEGKLDRQLIGVYVNGVKLNEWSATKFGRYTTTIPGELIEGGRIELRFDLPDATSVARLGIGDDQAIFAFQMISVALNKASTPRAE
jgi:Sulfatase